MRPWLSGWSHLEGLEGDGHGASAIEGRTVGGMEGGSAR